MQRLNALPEKTKRRPANSLPRDVLEQFLPRALFTLFASVLLALPGELLGFNPMGLESMMITLFFWIGAIMIVTFQGHAGRMFFWLIMLDSGMALYQAGIYSTLAPEDVFLRVAPAVLAATLFVFNVKRRGLQNPFLYWAWLLCNLPSLASSAFNEFISLEVALTFFFLNVIYPLVFYYAINCMQKSSMPRQYLRASITLAVIAMCGISIILIPVELSARNSTSYSSLQFGGRAYALVGLLLLIWPVLVSNILDWRLFQRLFAFFLIMMVFVTSFSRGALLALFLLILGIFFAGKKYAIKQLGAIALTVLALVMGAIIFLPQMVDDLSWFWLLRLNLANNLTTGLQANIGDVLGMSNRLDIWIIAIQLFIGNPLWGYGIGSTPFLVPKLTYYQFAYSGMHNLILTILVERGIVGLSGLLVLLGRIGYLITNSRTLFLPRTYLFYMVGIFLFFANTTGVEMFLNSNQIMNSSITVYMFLLIGFLEYKERKPNLP